MAPRVGVHGGLRSPPNGVGVVRSWANRIECGYEVVDGLCERCTRVYDGDGDEFHPSPISLEGRDERGVLLNLLCVFLVASFISLEDSLDEDEIAQLLINVVEAGVWCVRNASCVYEVR